MGVVFAGVFVGLLVFSVFMALNLWKKFSKNIKVMGMFPGPQRRLLFGNALEFERDPSAFVEQIMNWCDQFNGLFCLWLGPMTPLLFSYKPEVAEILLSSPAKHITKSHEYTFVHPWLGTGLLTSDGKKWKKRRRLITPTFHFKILNDFIQVFEEQSLILVSILESQPTAKALNIFPVIARCALDIIGKTSMGKIINAQQDSSSAYVKAVIRISELIQVRQKSPWLWPDWIYNMTSQGREQHKCLRILHGFTNQVIDERIQERKSNLPEEMEVDEFSDKRKRRLVAFLDLLLDAYDEGQIDKEGIREEVDTFMFEGHDTTAAGISWAIQLLGSHPDIQKRVQEEVDEFFGTRPDHLTVDTLKNLRYLELAIKESLRIFPSVPMFARELSEDCMIEGHVVPKGTTVGVAPIALHRNANVWPDPLKFDPDRFLPENSNNRHPYAYIPFSAGSRNCIGQRFAILEETMVLAYILHRFNIESVEATEDIKSCAELIMRPRDGIFVTLTPRIGVTFN